MSPIRISRILTYLLVGMFFFNGLSQTLTQTAVQKLSPSNLRHKMDDGYSAATDASGDYYIAGLSDGFPLILKYDPAGNLLWSKFFYPDVMGANTISMIIDGNNDLVILYKTYLFKINPSGQQLWQQTILNTVLLTKPMVDAANNIYMFVTKNDGAHFTQFDPNGNMTADIVYNYSTFIQYTTTVRDAAMDSNGDIVVTGDHPPNRSVISKFNTSGSVVWEFADTVAGGYMGTILKPGPGDTVYSLGYDGTNNKAIIHKLTPGGSKLWRDMQPNEAQLILPGNSGLYKVTGGSSPGLCKYGYAGGIVWTQPFGAPEYYVIKGGFADSFDNLYLTGYADSTGNSYRHSLAFMCNSSGVIQWLKKSYPPFPSFLHLNTASNFILKDNNGDILITGYTSLTDSAWNVYGLKRNENVLTIKYDKLFGNEIWKQTFESPINCSLKPVTINTKGIYPGGSVSFPMMGINLSNGGAKNEVVNNFLEMTPNVPNVNLQPFGRGNLARNLYAEQGAGYTLNGSDRDFALIYYSASANNVFFKYNGTANSNDEAYDILLEEYANTNYNRVYACGYVTNNLTGADMAVMKFVGLPHFITFNGTANDSDMAVSMAQDVSKKIYVAGYSTNSGSGKDITLLKYDTALNFLWSRTYNGGANADDRAQVVKTDKYGNVFVLGTANNSGSGQDITLLKYSAAGNFAWARNYNGSAGLDDRAVELEIDTSGNPYVAGVVKDSVNGEDYVTLKYDTAGNLKWAKIYNGTANTDDNATDMIVDSLGICYVTGFASNTGTGKDFFTLVYDTGGVVVDTEIFDDAQHLDDIPTKMIITGAREMVLAGFGGSSCTEAYEIVYCNPIPAPLGFSVSHTPVCAGETNYFEVKRAPYNGVTSGIGNNLLNSYTWYYGQQYLWASQSNGTNLSFPNGPVTDTLYVYCAQPGECGYPDLVTKMVVQVKLAPTMTITSSASNQSNVICQGDPVVLTGCCASTYTWSLNAGSSSAASVTLTPNSSDNFTVTGSNGTCTASVNLSITVTNTFAVSFFVNDSVCVSGANVTLSAWPSGGTFSGAGVSGNYFTPSVAGLGTHYIKYVPPIGGCYATDSVKIVVLPCVGITQYQQNRNLVYPNPFTDIVELRTGALDGNYVEIFDAQGKLIQIIQTTGNTISLGSLPAGMYYLLIRDKEQNIFYKQKITKQ